MFTADIEGPMFIVKIIDGKRSNSSPEERDLDRHVVLACQIGAASIGYLISEYVS